MAACPVYSFVNCYFSEVCVDRNDRLRDCTVDNIDSSPNKGTLVQDAEENRYAVKPVEQVIHELNTQDFDVYERGDWETKAVSGSSFALFRRGRGVEPYEFTPVTGNHYHVRGSEFVHDSILDRLLSKIRLPIEFPDYFRDAGILIDAVYTHQPSGNYVHNRTLERIGLQPMHRDRYCQREVFSRLGMVASMGHIDVALRMGNTLVLADVKRAAQERLGHKKQLLTYALAVDREVEEFEDFILINILHANKISDKKMNPRYDIMHVPKTSRLITQLEEEAEESFERQMMLIKNPELIRHLLESERDFMYPGNVAYMEYLLHHIDEIGAFLDPAFRRGLELANI